MKPVPMTPTPISRILSQSQYRSNFDRSARQCRLKRAVGQTKRLAAVMWGSRHWRTVFECTDKLIEFRFVGLGISLQEEIQERIAHFCLGLAPTPDSGRSQIFVQQHSGRSKDFHPLIVAVDRLAAAIDMALPTRSRAHLHHDRVEIAQLGQPGIHKSARRRHNLDRLFAEQPARHVEIVNHHITKNSAGMTIYSRGGNPGSRLVMITCRTSPISPASIDRRSCRALGSKRRLNATMTRPLNRSISWTAASTLAMSRSIGFSQSTAFPFFTA